MTPSSTVASATSPGTRSDSAEHLVAVHVEQPEQGLEHSEGCECAGGEVVAALLGELQADRADREIHESATEKTLECSLDIPPREHQRHRAGAQLRPLLDEPQIGHAAEGL